MRRLLAIAVLIAPLTGCASAAGSRPSSAPAASASSASSASTASADSSRLAGSEIEAADLPTAYELVMRLRRGWLRRGAGATGEVSVFMDERKVGGVEKLREILSVDVAALEYVPYTDAVQRWGSTVEGAVIVVVVRR